MIRFQKDLFFAILKKLIFPVSRNNFLESLDVPPQTGAYSCMSVVAILFAATAFIISFQVAAVAAFGLLALLIIFLFTFRYEWALSVLAATSFFLGLTISFSDWTQLQSLPIISGIDAPLIDILAILFLVAGGIGWILQLQPYRRVAALGKRRELYWYAGFLAASMVSLLFMYNHDTASGLKYLLRFMLFPFVAFVCLPAVLIHSRHLVLRVLRVWSFVGMGSAVFGLASLVMSTNSLWVRAAPFAVFGIAPLGFNHNLLAEVLTVLTPAAFYFFLHAKSHHERVVYSMGTSLMIVILLLTLSRAGWIAFCVELLCVAFFFRARVTQFLQAQKFYAVLLAAVVAAVILYMAFFLQSHIVASSNASRVAMVKVAAFYIAQSPVVGYGPGTFQTILGETYDYRLDFGDPLDAHGFVHKILLEEGLLGFIFFAGFLLAVLWRLWQESHSAVANKQLYQTLFLMVAGIVVFELFNTSYFNSVMWLPIGVALAAVYLPPRS